MSQKTRSSTIYTCDRCGDEGEFTEAVQYGCWAQINTQYKSGSSLLPHGYNADLCVGCAQSLGEWFRAMKDQ